MKSEPAAPNISWPRTVAVSWSAASNRSARRLPRFSSSLSFNTHLGYKPLAHTGDDERGEAQQLDVPQGPINTARMRICFFGSAPN
jgi:hypothetical protein